VLIRSLGAEDFLSFDRFELELQEGLTVVVGPNGGGKSNVVRILDVVRRGVEGADSEQPHGTSSLRVYADAARQGAAGGGFRVALGIALNEMVERELLVSWVRAAVMMEFLANEQTFRAREELDRFVFDRVSVAELGPLFEGRLVVVYEAAPSNSFVVGYEFTFEDETFCYQLAGGSRTGMIVAGELDPRPGPSSYSPKQGRALLLDDPGTTSPPPQEPLVFSFERLLPRGFDGVRLTASSMHIASESRVIEDFYRRFGFDFQAARGMYTLAAVFAPLLREIAVVRDHRGTPRKDFRADELAIVSEGSMPVELPRELLRLRQGTAAERARFAEIQARFRQLTEAEFDLQVAPASSPSSLASAVGATPQALMDYENRSEQAERIPWFNISVRVRDGAVDVPLEFAGAGRWESLVLSAALPESGGSIVLDEPATSLHATLQRRLLDQLRQRRAQSLLITHSPFLVPASQAELSSIVRLSRHDGITQTHKLAPSSGSSDDEHEAQVARLEQMLSLSSDVRALLFAQAVILAEGGTEKGALDRWLPQAAAHAGLRSPEDSNIVIVDVGGDPAFASFVHYLNCFGLPWVIFCDGQALDPTYTYSLWKRLPGSSGSEPPEQAPDFPSCRAFWAQRGVFTVADSFGANFESFAGALDAEAYAASCNDFPRSKTRRGIAFASRVACPTDVKSIYAQMLTHLQFS